MSRIVRRAVLFVVGLAVFLNTAHAEEVTTAKSKPTVYIHITRENDPLDKAIENAYAKNFTIVEVRNSKEFNPAVVRESVHPHLVLSESTQEPKGDVLVVIIVTTDGRPIEPVILKSADKRLNAAMLDAVKQWRFTPARLNGSSVSEAFYVLFSKAAGAKALAIFAPRPAYPKDERGHRPTGQGVVVMDVDPKTGWVTSARMEKSTRVVSFSTMLLLQHSADGVFDRVLFGLSILRSRLHTGESQKA